jgi:formylglycine-generating enzyme required for sulfatase activity
MKKLLLAVTLLMAMLLAACGSGERGAEGGDSGAQAPANTPTPVVLATPTPRPVPATPTARPTPIPAPVEEPGGESEATAEESTAAAVIARDMIDIPAGTYTIGQNNSKPKNGPAHEVELPAFAIDQFEVTNDDFAAFVEATAFTTYAEESGNSKTWRTAAEGKGNHPVVYVTWDDAVAFCEWAGGRLPSEEEWETAARGQEGNVYPWGNNFVAENGNFYESGYRGTTAVGSFPAGSSPFGAEDMAGNVREWTSSYFLPYPGQDPGADRFFGEEYRVNRGGGWFDGQDGELVTTYNRNAGPPDTSANDDIGFRCARDGQ